MAKFEKRSADTDQEVPTTAIPDIVFMLLIFFMVTTVLREIDLKVKVNFAQAKNIEKIEQKRLVSYIYIGPEKLPGNKLGDSKVQIDDDIIEDIGSIRQIMYDKYQEQPKLIVSMRVDADTEFGIVTDVEQELREAGTLRLNYSTHHEIE